MKSIVLFPKNKANKKKNAIFSQTTQVPLPHNDIMRKVTENTHKKGQSITMYKLPYCISSQHHFNHVM